MSKTMGEAYLDFQSQYYGQDRMNHCRRCGKEIETKVRLRCNECRKLVDEEFNGQTSRPYRFYFEWYNKWGKSNAKNAEKK